MNYTGKLYGKIGNKYVLLRMSSEDVDAKDAAILQLNQRVAELVASLTESRLKAVPLADVTPLVEAIITIHQPLGGETETSGNPCCSPNSKQGRAISKAITELIAKHPWWAKHA